MHRLPLLRQLPSRLTIPGELPSGAGVELPLAEECAAPGRS